MRNFTQLFFLLAAYVLPIGAQAQSLQNNYSPLSSYYPSKAYMKGICAGYDSIYHSTDFSKNDESRNFKNSMEGIKKQIYSITEDSALMHNDVITNYLRKMTQHIKDNNIVLKDRKLQVFTYRTSNCNASSYGNGIIFFNLNLLASFKSEASVAFILCHEISHDLKGHLVREVSRNYKIVNDPLVKRQYALAKHQQFNKYKSYENYVAITLQKINSKNREDEVQADSLGLILYRNAGYDLKYAYETIERLDSMDNLQYSGKIDYPKYFSSDAQPFKNSWLEPEEQEETIGGGNLENAKYPDSLKTHPDCKYRLKMLQTMNIPFTPAKTGVSGFDSVKTIAEFEMLKVYIEDSELSKGFYNCLHLLGRYPGNQYIKANVVEYLYDVYTLKKNHYLSTMVDTPDPKYIAAYNEILYFLNNVSPDACRTMMTEFFRANFNESISDPYVAYVYLLVKSIDKSTESKETMVKQYETDFGKNDYYRLLNQRLLKKTS